MNYDTSKIKFDLFKGRQMELNQLKIAFDSGALKSAVITLAAMENGYSVLFISIKNKVINMTKQRSDKDEPRVFKSIDAAVANIEKVGFKEIKIKL